MKYALEIQGELSSGARCHCLRTAGAALDIPGIPSNAQFPNTLPTFQPSGYQQIGSPTSTASDFSTGVTEIADSLTWLKGRHTMKMGLDWRWERLNVIQPPWPTGQFVFTTVGSDLPGVANTGNALASFLLGQVQTFAIDLQQTDYSGARTLSGVLHPGRLEGIRAPDAQSRASIHAEFPIHGDQRPDCRVQSADKAARISRYRSGTAAQEEQLRSTLWRRLSTDGQNHHQFGLREGLDRDGGDYHALHDAQLSISPGCHRRERSTTSRQRSC